MRDAIEEVLLLQTDYSPDNTESMKRRGYIVRTELRDELNELIPAMSARSGIDDLRVRGKDGTGRKTEIPWTRIYHWCLYAAQRGSRPRSGVSV